MTFDDPLTQFDLWLREAEASEPNDPNACALATATASGAPSVRMQLAMSAVLAVSGSLVLILIIALSNPFRGDFRVTAAPFEHMLARMKDAGVQP